MADVREESNFKTRQLWADMIKKIVDELNVSASGGQKPLEVEKFIVNFIPTRVEVLRSHRSHVRVLETNKGSRCPLAKRATIINVGIQSVNSDKLKTECIF